MKVGSDRVPVVRSLPAAKLPQRRRHFRERNALLQVSVGPAGKGLSSQRPAVKAREDGDLGARREAPDLRDRLEAVQDRHREVENDRVRLFRSSQRYSFRPVSGLADDPEPTLKLEVHPDQLSDLGGIVGEQDANRNGRLAHPSPSFGNRAGASRTRSPGSNWASPPSAPNRSPTMVRAASRVVSTNRAAAGASPDSSAYFARASP